MKFGLFGGAMQGRGETADSQGYRKFIDMVVQADQLGYESVFMVEHHFSGIGQVSATLNFISHIAARTEQIRLGTAITVLPWHNPILLAEEVATTDLLSGGRLDFGAGKGYRDIEFKGFKIPKEEAQERFDETLEILLKAWTSEERFSYEGKWWSYEDVIVEPEPVQKPHPPLWTGAGTLESCARVGRTGFNLLLDQYGDSEITSNRLKAFQDSCEESGRVYNPMEVGLTRAVTLTRSAEETRDAKEMRAKRAANMSRFGKLPGLREQPKTFSDGSLVEDDAAIIGQPDEVIARLKELESQGVGYVMALASGALDLKFFADEVMPVFADRAAAAE